LSLISDLIDNVVAFIDDVLVVTDPEVGCNELVEEAIKRIEVYT